MSEINLPSEERKGSCPFKSDIALTQQSIDMLRNGIKEIVSELREIRVVMEVKYVTKEEFRTVQRLVYGAAGIILLSALISLLALVLPHTKAIG